MILYDLQVMNQEPLFASDTGYLKSILFNKASGPIGEPQGISTRAFQGMGSVTAGRAGSETINKSCDHHEYWYHKPLKTRAW